MSSTPPAVECSIGVFHAPAVVADFPPTASRFYQRTHRVRLKNLNTDDKKSSHKIRHIKIPIEHIFLYRQIPLTLLNGYLSFSM